MKYVAYKRFKGVCMSGKINIPYGTLLEEREGILYYENQPVCFNTSQNAYDYFACDDDEQGLKRGTLTRELIKTLSNRDVDYQVRWDKLWDSEFALQFKRKEHADFWVWGFDFYNASISDLLKIKSLIKL